jgi:5,10-methenyltetrahydrofolate synthetase
MSDDAQNNWKQWRREQRRRLLDERSALPSATRRTLSARVIANLDRALQDLPCKTLGIYWPIKREIDLLKWAGNLSAERGISLAVPVVQVANTPLDYCLWQPGERMIRGFWSIPEPADRRLAHPDIVIAPLVGFYGFWRLGYGGGYFDRTLAARSPSPIAIGIGFDASELPDFAPQNHDLPMKLIVTDGRIINSDI